ncbi:hypothetical protein B0H17DRAFT_1139324 [Mycena rosella]|uniref:Uncharacterized protein n=1 Tax=Mycena rosella TaxID=1033263 RepID=A0AAD7D4X9_MYCRO|nr:hypothetical protein B0H17DRAFT_1139324 [Mycena rosella]
MNIHFAPEAGKDEALAKIELIGNIEDLHALAKERTVPLGIPLGELARSYVLAGGDASGLKMPGVSRGMGQRVGLRAGRVRARGDFRGGSRVVCGLDGRGAAAVGINIPLGRGLKGEGPGVAGTVCSAGCASVCVTDGGVGVAAGCAVGAGVAVVGAGAGWGAGVGAAVGGPSWHAAGRWTGGLGAPTG